MHLTYLGTGCIFEYENKQEFSGRYLPNFFDRIPVLAFTDRLMHQLDDGVLNLRIRMPITDEIHPRNFITKITRYAKICSVPNSMTVLDDLLPLLLDMSLRGTTGTVNLCNPGVLSHNEILEMYRDIVDPTFAWENFSLEEQAAVLAAGRSNNRMGTARLEELYPGVPPLRAAVEAALRRMAAGRGPA